MPEETPEALSSRLVLILKDGRRVVPVKQKSRRSGKVAWLLSRGSNRRDDAKEVDDEDQMIQRVLSGQYSIRCRPSEGGPISIYGLGRQSVAWAELDGKRV
jgi:hypothetical protein